MNIAIIGAGVSGLTTAYYLRKNPLLAGASITIYEKADRVGGNADTLEVLLPDGSGGTINRWIDMGVNDFNKTTYINLRGLWEELGIMTPNKPCPSSDYCSPLIDTESFSFPDNDYQYRYWIDDKGNVNIPPGSTAPGPLLQNDINNFKQILADWYTDHKPEKDYNISVGEWLAQTVPPFSQDFIYGNLYPRINGMYYTLEGPDAPGIPAPSTMPIWMVAHYYILQEAYGQKIRPEMDCHRQYFVNGSTTWLTILAKKLTEEMGVTIYYDTPPIRVSKKDAQMIVSCEGVIQGAFDKVIFATHADDTYAMIDETFQSDEMVQALKNFNYSTSTIYVHQDPTFLGPGDMDATYNIHAYNYQGGGNYPYTISYIVNFHQNDPARHIQNPLFYLTINPYWTGGAPPSNMLNFTDGSPAIGTLKHAKLDSASVDGQILINQIQLLTPLERSYYFTGSFTIGAGLHEECIIHAKEIAQKVADTSYISRQTYNFNKKKDRHFAPQYILDAITRIKKKD